jgi:hypothetical protein
MPSNKFKIGDHVLFWGDGDLIYLIVGYEEQMYSLASQNGLNFRSHVRADQMKRTTKSVCTHCEGKGWT